MLFFLFYVLVNPSILLVCLGCTHLVRFVDIFVLPIKMKIAFRHALPIKGYVTLPLGMERK